MGVPIATYLPTLTPLRLQNSFMLMAKNIFNRSTPMPDNGSPTGDKNVIVSSSETHRFASMVRPGLGLDPDKIVRAGKYQYAM